MPGSGVSYYSSLDPVGRGERASKDSGEGVREELGARKRAGMLVLPL